MALKDYAPLVSGSVALHGVAAGVLAWQPAAWPWVVGAVLADHAALTAAGLWPRSTLLGHNMTTLPAAAHAARQVAITIDDGPHPDITPQVLVDRESQKFRDLWKDLGISNDGFIRTTDDHHKRGVQEMFAKIRDNGFIYKAKYTGQYCVSDELSYLAQHLGQPVARRN